MFCDVTSDPWSAIFILEIYLTIASFFFVFHKVAEVNFDLIIIFLFIDFF